MAPFWFVAACFWAVLSRAALITVPPVKVNNAGTDLVEIPPSTTIGFTDKSLQDAVDLFVEDIQGYKLTVKPATTGDPAFLLTLTQDDVDIEKAKFPNEAYKIFFESGKITVKARAATGALWGTKTLLQLAKQVDYRWPASGYIFDEPNDERRWFGVDCARHYFEPEFLKSVIKRASNMKMNGFLMHAVDSEGFRYDLPEYPGLAPAGRSYNESVVSDLVEFANRNGVDVIPGFEFPGHSAVMNSYFDVGVMLPGYEYITMFVTDVTSPKTLDVVHGLLSAILPWFKEPKYVHLGGDEVPEAIMQMYPPFTDMVTDNPDKYGTVGDYLTDWLNQLVDWTIAEFPHTRPIIYNGFENVVEKVEVSRKAIMHYWEGDFSYYDKKGGYTVLASDETKLYFAPATNSHVFPDLDELNAYDLETYTKTTSNADSPNEYFGSAFLHWVDNNYYQDDIMMTYGFDALALTAAKQWNRDTSEVYKGKAQFQGLMNFLDPKGGDAVVDASEYFNLDSVYSMKQLHYYQFENEISQELPAMCEGTLCIFAQDHVGTLHGVGQGGTDTLGKPNPGFIEGIFGSGFSFHENEGSTNNPLSFGGMDIKAPWTLSFSIRAPNQVAGQSLFWAAESRIVNENQLGHLAFEQTGVKSVDLGIGLPKSDEWSNVIITTDGLSTYTYINGELKATVAGSMSLPMFSIGGPKEMLVMDLDNVRIFSGAATEENANIVMNLAPDESPEDHLVYPTKQNEDASSAKQELCVGAAAALAVCAMTIL